MNDCIPQHVIILYYIIEEIKVSCRNVTRRVLLFSPSSVVIPIIRLVGKIIHGSTSSSVGKNCVKLNSFFYLKKYFILDITLFIIKIKIIKLNNIYHKTSMKKYLFEVFIFYGIYY